MAVTWAFNYLVGGGLFGLVFGLLFAAGVPLLAWWKSDSITLSISRAHPADETTYARYHNLVEGLCLATGAPKPKLYVIRDEAPNAFATGRNPQHSAICCTTGLLEKMNRVELEGVLAHELSHILNRDTLISTLVVVMVGLMAVLSDWGIRWLWWGGGRTRNRSSETRGNGANLIPFLMGMLLLVLAPLLGKLTQALVSRSRESLADISGVGITRYPPGLISALKKLEADDTVVHSHSRATAHLWIESPIARTEETGRLSRINHLFETHPPLRERIRALEDL